MNNKETVEKLKTTIYKILGPLLQGKRTILTDLPYHGNVGDILIWEGEVSFLNNIGAIPLTQTSSLTFHFPKLDEDIIICLHGGGNFGDLYYEAQVFRKKIIEAYPNNRIIIFPQSVWYENKYLIQDDVKVFFNHTDLHICARDLESYQFFKSHFDSCKIYLVPDMAFCIQNINQYYTDENKKTQRALFIKRLDKEGSKDFFKIDEPYDKRDWPIFEGKSWGNRILFGMIRRCSNVPNNNLRLVFSKIFDKIMERYVKEKLINKGTIILKQYNNIYTTRLHAMILAILMDKKVVSFDNITKKLSSFYNTWLKDNENVVFKNN